MNHRLTVPPIKCQGIKTKLIPWLWTLVPQDFNGTWIEPFMGSGVVAFNLLPRRALLADSNPHIINFYQAIASGQLSGSSVRHYLVREGGKLLDSQGEHYYVIRERFNQTGDSLDFLFLNRACFNGLMRFNRKKEFNVPFCRRPSRFSSAYITKIVNQVNRVAAIIRVKDYQFSCMTYETTIRSAVPGDVIYADPPYISRHNDYYNGWDDSDEQRLATELQGAPCRLLLSTWHSNSFRSNSCLGMFWSQYHISTREYFYHVGARENNRHPMVEALVTNYDPSELSTELDGCETTQLGLLHPVAPGTPGNNPL